jgi:hypothetical protein
MVGTSNYIARPSGSQTGALLVAITVSLVAYVAAAAGLAGCAVGSAQQPPTAPSQPANWSLTFHLTGGFAGYDRQMDLASSGAATVADRRRNVTRAAQISADDLKTINALVAGAHSTDVRAPGCADCFDYTLDIQGASGPITIRANDAGMSGSDAAPLVTALSQLLNKHLNQL